MSDDLLTRVRAAISDPKAVVGPRERGNPDDMYDAGETLANWQARAVLAGVSDVDALIEGADRAYADENHHNLCMCDSWPDACVTGLTVGGWATGATDSAVKFVLAQLGALPKEA